LLQVVVEQLPREEMTEPQVTALLGHLGDDPVGLRRALVDAGLLWRTPDGSRPGRRARAGSWRPRVAAAVSGAAAARPPGHPRRTARPRRATAARTPPEPCRTGRIPRSACLEWVHEQHLAPPSRPGAADL